MKRISTQTRKYQVTVLARKGYSQIQIAEILQISPTRVYQVGLVCGITFHQDRPLWARKYDRGPNAIDVRMARNLR